MIMISNLTVYDLIYKALRMAGVVGLGDALDPLQANEALVLLNAIRAEYSLNTRGQIKYDATIQPGNQAQFITMGNTFYFGTVANVGALPADASYGNTATVTGSGDYVYTDSWKTCASQAWIVQRPSQLDQIIVVNPNGNVDASNVNYKIPLYTYEEYRKLAAQQIFAIPQAAYMDINYPLQKLYLYPGMAVGWALRLEGYSYLTDYENVSDPYIDPPEFFQMLWLDLANRMLLMYGQDIPEGLLAMYNGVSKHIKAKGFRNKMKRATNDFKSAGHGFNFFAGN